MNWSYVVAEEHIVVIIRHVESCFVVGEVVMVLVVAGTGHVRNHACYGLYFLHEYVPSLTIELGHVIRHVTHMDDCIIQTCANLSL